MGHVGPWAPPGGVDSATVSLVVSTRDRPAAFDRLCSALARQLPSTPDGSVELIVIFDGCEPYADVGFLNSEVPTRLIHHRTSAGFAASRNEGIRSSTGTVIAFLDDDAIPASNWIGSLRRGLREHPSASMFGGRVRRLPSQDSVTSLLRDHVYYRETFGAWYLAPDSPAGAAPVDQVGAPYVNGGNSAYRREVFREGGFRTDLPGYVDVEFGRRCCASSRAVLLDGMSILHEHPDRLADYFARCHRSGRARRRLSSLPEHRAARVVTSAATNVVYGNWCRIRGMERRRPSAFGILALQEMIHVAGFVRG